MIYAAWTLSLPLLLLTSWVQWANTLIPNLAPTATLRINMRITEQVFLPQRVSTRPTIIHNGQRLGPTSISCPLGRVFSEMCFQASLHAHLTKTELKEEIKRLGPPSPSQPVKPHHDKRHSLNRFYQPFKHNECLLNRFDVPSKHNECKSRDH
jgi:hypothetical protein